MTLQVGFTQAVITPTIDPKKPVFLAGFGNNRVAKEVHDDLYVRVLCLNDGKTTLILCALDLIGFFRLDVQSVLHKLETSETFRSMNPQVIIASTHTHHGPDTLGLWGPNNLRSGVDPVYMEMLRGKIAATIMSSLIRLKPIHMKAAEVRVPGVAKNARDPEIVDDHLMVVQFTSSETGEPVATLVDFPCHPEVLSDHNTLISSDYPAYLRQSIEQASGAPCIFFAGSLGGMMTPDVVDHSLLEAEKMGENLSKAALKALQNAEDCPGEPLTLEKKKIDPKLTNNLYKIAFKQKLLPDVRNSEGRVESEVNLIRLGDVWLATVPGELLPKIGLALKAGMISAGARVPGIIGLANDELGYILPEEDFHYPLNPFKPGKHYEETNSIGKEIASQVVEAISSMM